MKFTLLGIVQDILNDLDSDEVNSITDTMEAMQVAQIVQSTYFEMMSQKDWPHLRSLGQLESLSDNTRKTALRIPETVSRLNLINYDKKRLGDTRSRWSPLKYKEPEVFLRDANSLNTDNTNVETTSIAGGVTISIKNDRAPEYWTSFDDEVVIVDGFDSTVETTSQGINTQAYYFKTPSFTITDGFIPDLPTEAFPALMAEAKSVSALRINKEADQKAEQQATRQRRRMSNQAWVAKGGIRRANYGRVPRKGTISNHNNLLDKES